MDTAQRVGKARKAVALEPFGVLPFRQSLRHALQRRVDRFAHLIRMQSFGQRVDRIDQRQTGEARLVDDTVGMNHLQMAVVECGGARHVAQSANRKELFQIVPAGVEIGDGQRVGVVAGFDVVGRARAVRRRRTMAFHRDGDRHHGVGHDLAQLRLAAAVDEAGRQVEQKIDDPRRLTVAREQTGKQFFQLRPDAGKVRQRREQRVEQQAGALNLNSSFRGAAKRRARNP